MFCLPDTPVNTLIFLRTKLFEFAYKKDPSGQGFGPRVVVGPLLPLPQLLCLAYAKTLLFPWASIYFAWRNMAKYGEIWRNNAKYGEIWWNNAKYGEIAIALRNCMTKLPNINWSYISFHSSVAFHNCRW